MPRSQVAATHRNHATGPPVTAVTPSSKWPTLSAQCLDQASFGRRQQPREDLEIAAAGGTKPERHIHVDPDHMPARRQPQLSLTGELDVPGLMLLVADQGVFAVRAEASVGSGLASGAGEVVVAAGLAVFGPSAGLEVPAAEGPDNDMDASR
jgi:hypothetical protein